jgi:peptidoglycan/xylan/chitin deacetylase (PgdA/CDA1 family)
LIRNATGIILTYHRIDRLERDPLALAVPPERFAAHIRELGQLGDVVELAEVGRRQRPTIAITMDDGYADAAEIAAPILERAGVPATLFVTSGVLDGKGEFWWDALEHLLLDSEAANDAIELEIGGRSLHVDVRSAAGRGRALRALNHRLRVLPHSEIDQLVAEVARQLGSVSSDCTHHRHLTHAQLKALHAGGVIEIGAHTQTHTMLTALDEVDQRSEIEGSRRVLTEVTGATVRSFAYPFGNAGSYDTTTVRLARRCGFDQACVNTGGGVRGHVDRYRLPRYPVHDWPPDELRERARRWLAVG